MTRTSRNFFDGYCRDVEAGPVLLRYAKNLGEAALHALRHNRLPVGRDLMLGHVT